MSHTFDLKFNHMRDNAPDRVGNSLKSIIRYEKQAYDRKICFIQEDGNRLRLNYALLIAENYHPEKNSIVLVFTSCTITLIGIRLDKLYSEFELNMPRIIAIEDIRYNSMAEEDEPIVNSIQIVNN